MDKLFLAILKMSITSSYVILFVIIARLLLKKSPKIFSYMLWSVVLFRLICPISFESKLSLIPNTTISEEALTLKKPANNNDYTAYNVPNYLMDETGKVVDVIGETTTIDNTEEAINSFNFTPILAVLWLIVISIMISYSTFSIIKLKKRLKDSKHINDNIYESKNINTAFVIGVFNPKIYIPQGLSRNEEQYIVAHERIHLKRYDYLIKLVSYVVLCIHCFNPLVWISFMLMSKDMEMSCDEAVIKEIGSGIKKEYSKSLVSFATNNKSIAITPTAFGEGDVKSRIKNILNYKKPSFWVIILSVIVIIGVSLGVLANPINGNNTSSKEIEPYLNFDNALGNISQDDKIIIRTVGKGGCTWSGAGFVENFKKHIDALEVQEIKEVSDISDSIIVYIFGNANYRLSFYEDRPELLSITYDGESKYYTFSKDVYNEVKIMSLLSSYIIPEEVMIAVMDGKKTNKTSYEDRPLGVDYSKLTVGDSICFIYENKGKYYVEKPYFAIYEISEEVYKAALQYAVPQGNSNLGDDNNGDNSNEEGIDNQGNALPDFEYSGEDIIEKLVYDAASTQYIIKTHTGAFTVFAAKIFESYEEENKIKIFSTIYTSIYNYDVENKIVEEIGGNIVPVAITYTKNDDGTYTLEEYLQSGDGAEWEPSIREFCTMPVSGKNINGLADKIINHYLNYDDLIKIQRNNLIEHLEDNNESGVSLLVRGYDEPDMIIELTP